MILFNYYITISRKPIPSVLLLGTYKVQSTSFPIATITLAHEVSSQHY